MFSQTIQYIVNIMIVIMAAFLVLFTLLLTVMHFIMNAKQERMQRIKRRILQLISNSERVLYMKEQVYSVVDSNAPDLTLQQIRGIRSRRGIQVLELVARELNETQLHVLRLAVNNQWYSEYLHRVMNGKIRRAFC